MRACDFGGNAHGHYLAPDPAAPGGHMLTTTPHAWPYEAQAQAALDAWEAAGPDK